MDVHQAIRIAEKQINDQLAKGVQDLNWKGIIAAGEYVQTEPEAIWAFVAKWGCHSSKDLRDGIATCILEHLLEFHFELIFPRVEVMARKDKSFADTFSGCWKFGQAELPANSERWDGLSKALSNGPRLLNRLSWISGKWPGRLAIMPRPRGGDWLEDEVNSWHLAGVNVVVSLLTRDEIKDLDLAAEKALCEAHEIEFVSLPIPDRGVPESQVTVANLATNLAHQLHSGRNVAIHCRQGIGRAALVAACLLVVLGVDPESAMKQISLARGCDVPETAEQSQWVFEFAKCHLAPV